jgi:hypothetical protein
MSGSEEGSGTPDVDRNAAFWPEDDEEIEVDYMHLGSEDSGGKRGHGKSRQGIGIYWCCAQVRSSTEHGAQRREMSNQMVLVVLNP